MCIRYEHVLAMVLFCIVASVPAAAQDPKGATQGHAHSKVRTPPIDLSDQEARVSDLYRKVLPTVVTITSTRSVVTAEGWTSVEGLGSGVLLSPNCHVLTAAHVVEGADSITVKTHDGKSYPAQLLFSEPSADIALLRFLDPDPSLAHAELGDSDRLTVGQTIYILGSPYGLENSFSAGIISGFRNFNRLYDGTIQAEFIQTDAAMNSGNSGGPAFDSKGQVIGIASQILSVSGGFQGIGFVVAINTAKKLLALEDRAWTGIEGMYLNGEELAELLNHDLEGGLLITRVASGSPAEKAGLRGGSIPATLFGRDIRLGGDLIIELGSQPTCHAECLVDARSHIAGLDRIPVKYIRAGKIRTTEIDVSESRRNFLEDK